MPYRSSQPAERCLHPRQPVRRQRVADNHCATRTLFSVHNSASRAFISHHGAPHGGAAELKVLLASRVMPGWHVDLGLLRREARGWRREIEPGETREAGGVLYCSRVCCSGRTRCTGARAPGQATAVKYAYTYFILCAVCVYCVPAKIKIRLLLGVW